MTSPAVTRLKGLDRYGVLVPVTGMHLIRLFLIPISLPLHRYLLIVLRAHLTIII